MYCDGMPRRALGDHLVVASLFFGSQLALGMRVEVGAIDAEHKHQQRLGVQARRAHVGGFQLFYRRRERLLQLHGEILAAAARLAKL